MTTNELIASKRRAARISQGRLANCARLSKTTISQFELVNISPRLDQVLAFAEILKSELATHRSRGSVTKQAGIAVRAKRKVELGRQSTLSEGMLRKSRKAISNIL